MYCWELSKDWGFCVSRPGPGVERSSGKGTGEWVGTLSNGLSDDVVCVGLRGGRCCTRCCSPAGDDTGECRSSISCSDCESMLNCRSRRREGGASRLRCQWGYM